MAYGQNYSLDNLLQLAQAVYYDKEYKEENRRQKRTRQKTEVPAMAVRFTVKQPEEKNVQRTQVSKDRLTITGKGGTSQARLHSGI